MNTVWLQTHDLVGLYRWVAYATSELIPSVQKQCSSSDGWAGIPEVVVIMAPEWGEGGNSIFNLNTILTIMHLSRRFFGLEVF